MSEKEARIATVVRTTKETDIQLTLNLDGTGQVDAQTGVGFFDHMLNAFARHGLFDLTVKCEGDTWVDAHHTVEDVGIVLGQAFAEALGSGKTLGDAFKALADGAAKGLESTRSMQAKIGRAARLGERSIGHLDAGATSCDVILETLAEGLGEQL